MKNFFCLAFLLFLLPTTLPAQPEPQTAPIFRKHFSLKLAGGLARWSMGDWNDYYGGLKTSQGRLRGGVGAVFYGEDFHYGIDGEAEIRFSFHPLYKVGVSVGRAWGGVNFGWEQSGVNIYQQYKWTDEDFRDETIDAQIIPVLLTFYAGSNTYPNQPYIGLGAGYYFSTFQQMQDVDNYYRQDSLNTKTDEYKTLLEFDAEYKNENEMSAGGFGFHAVVGTEYFITPSLSIVGEVTGRYVKISGFKGTGTLTSPDTTATRDVKAVVSTRLDETGDYKVYGFGAWDGAEPLPPPQQNYRFREAVLDFSGVSGKLGISYHF